jgi:hypothetical protein
MLKKYVSPDFKKLHCTAKRVWTGQDLQTQKYGPDKTGMWFKWTKRTTRLTFYPLTRPITVSICACGDGLLFFSIFFLFPLEMRVVLRLLNGVADAGQTSNKLLKRNSRELWDIFYYSFSLNSEGSLCNLYHGLIDMGWSLSKCVPALGCFHWDLSCASWILAKKN